MHPRSAGTAVTLVAADDFEFARWSAGARAGRYTIVGNVELLEDIVRVPRPTRNGETVRVVIDGGIDLDRFLFLVATVPDTFEGEMLFISRDGSGYLSTRELGNVRTVRAVTQMDVEVYLRWHNLPARPRASYEVESH